MSKMFTFLLLAAVLAACGPVSPVPEGPFVTPPPSPRLISTRVILSTPARWNSVTMRQSGGFVGVSRMIQVASDGAFVVRDERAKIEFEGRLSREKMAELNEFLLAVSHIAPSDAPSACLDCFIYSVEIFSAGKPMRLQADDMSLPNSGLAPLVEFLRGIMERPATATKARVTPTQEIYIMP